MCWALWSWRSQWLALLIAADGPRLVRSLLLLLGVFWLDALGWHLILRALGEKPQIAQSFWIWMASSLGRYLPGGIWPYASRVVMSVDSGIPLATASISLYLETLLLVVSSLAVGLPALAFSNKVGVSLLQAVLGLGVCLAALHPRVIALLGRLPGRVGAVMARVTPPSATWMLGLSLYYFFFWLLFGAVFWDFCAAIEPAAPAIFAASAFALAFFIGFITLFVPGGIGVREAALYVLLVPHLSPAAALAISVGSRFWVTVGEAGSVALAWLGRPRRAA